MSNDPDKLFKLPAAVLMAALIMILGFGNCVLAQDITNNRIGVVYFVYSKGIKPYEVLADGIVNNLDRNIETRIFEIEQTPDIRKLKKELDKFNPSLIVCVGNTASTVCSDLNIAPMIAAYDTDLVEKQDPFCLLKYLYPETKKVLCAIDGKLNEKDRSLLALLAAGYDFEFGIVDSSGDVGVEAFLQNDAIYLGKGALVINTGSSQPTGSGGCIGVTDKSIKFYSELTKRFAGGMSQIKEVVDIAGLTEESKVRKMIEKKSPAAIVCFGAAAFAKCRCMEDTCRVSLVLETIGLEGNLNKWGKIWGIDMYVDPLEQIELLYTMTTGDMKIAVPYNPEHTELMVIRAQLAGNGISIKPVPILQAKNATKILEKAFEDYDGMWIIPEATLSAAPIQRYLLEQSLKKEKILISMMHPYTKGGAIMSLSSVGTNEDDLVFKIIDLINIRTNVHSLTGKIAPPPMSMSLNVRTFKKICGTEEKLKCEASNSLVDLAEFVYGED